ncbi:hypothetical protein JA9_001500 [Meyerozyma sp. JA9]|nr:hypothetical protein JA9_001500 [Meyerozyma sp. JA9]
MKKRFQEWFYTLSTNDKYSDFDSRKSFNRVYNSSSDVLFHQTNASSASLMAPERNSADIDLASQMDGVHEVRLAWRHIKNWASKHFPEVESTLQSPCTDSDLAEVQKDLGIILPNCVSEFYKLTDGQEFLQGSVGLIYGLRLLPIDQVVVETENWRKVVHSTAQQAPGHHQKRTLSQLGKAQVHQVSESDLTSHSSSSVDLFESTSKPDSDSRTDTSSFSHSFIPKQRSIPPGAIHDTYAHDMWIPLVTDGVGNCIGIDLSPPPNGPGVSGQVILFGREFDTKYQVAKTWGDFLLIFANDLENGNFNVKQPTEDMDYGDMLFGSIGELVFYDKETKEELDYFEVLKRRAMKQWLSSIDESQQTETVKSLISQFRAKKTMLVPLKEMSVDDVIRSNLASIDTINEPLNMKQRSKLVVKTTSKTSSDNDKSDLKSPLSQEIEFDLADSES